MNSPVTVGRRTLASLSLAVLMIAPSARAADSAADAQAQAAFRDFDAWLTRHQAARAAA